MGIELVSLDDLISSSVLQLAATKVELKPEDLRVCVGRHYSSMR